MGAVNCPVNPKLAWILGMIFVACKNCLSSLECNLMVGSDERFESIPKSIRESMQVWKQSHKNCAIMRELTYLHPSIPSRDKWDGNKLMIDKWFKTRPALIEAQDNENAYIDIDENVHTNNKAKHYNDMLE